MPAAHIEKTEDARTGQWLSHLDSRLDPVIRVDYGWTMGDWNQMDYGVETVALRAFMCSCLPFLLSSYPLTFLPCLYQTGSK